MVLEDLGGIIFFTDPLTAHPHAEDIATLLRMADMNNVMHATNPITAVALVPVLRAVAEGSAARSHRERPSRRLVQPPSFSLWADKRGLFVLESLCSHRHSCSHSKGAGQRHTAVQNRTRPRTRTRTRTRKPEP